MCVTNSSLKQRVSCMGKSEIGKIGSLSRTHFVLWVKQRIKIVQERERESVLKMRRLCKRISVSG